MCHNNKMPSKEEYKYILKYIDNEDTITSEFSGYISIDDIAYKLRDFLCACGWAEERIKEIIRLEEE